VLMGKLEYWHMIYHPRGPPTPLYTEHRVSFMGLKRPGLGAEQPPPSSYVVEYGYACTPRLCLIGMTPDSLYIKTILRLMHPV
jgi:hypothetical protein